MQREDWAIIVGVQCYPGLPSNLEGPENDARAFHQWIQCQTGGNVPKDQVKLILSSDYNSGPPFPPASKAMPAQWHVQQAFDELREKAEKNSRMGKGRNVGRRLYIYLAGHGCELELFPSLKCRDEVVLLMANATPRSTGYSIPGRLYAEHFLEAGFFKELVLFMDCCRESYSRVLTTIPYARENANALDMTKQESYCFGFGTKSSGTSRETLMEDGLVHGVYTTALLKGLEGAACEPDGRITAASLQGYLFNNMKDLLAPEDRNNPAIVKDPELEYNPTARHTFVIAHITPPTFTVAIHIPTSSVGKKVEICKGERFALEASTIAKDPVWKLPLKRGIYLAQILEDALQVIFEVSGTEGIVNVDF